VSTITACVSPGTPPDPDLTRCATPTLCSLPEVVNNEVFTDKPEGKPNVALPPAKVPAVNLPRTSMLSPTRL